MIREHKRFSDFKLFSVALSSMFLCFTLICGTAYLLLKADSYRRVANFVTQSEELTSKWLADPEVYKYAVEHDPEDWCRAVVVLDVKNRNTLSRLQGELFRVAIEMRNLPRMKVTMRFPENPDDRSNNFGYMFSWNRGRLHQRCRVLDRLRLVGHHIDCCDSMGDAEPICEVGFRQLVFSASTTKNQKLTLH